MSVRRVLVNCVVLSLQDPSVFYPSCKGCFSRINVEQRDAVRCRCSKCGYLCLKEQVDYRYRLSLRVTRDKHIFGITVFGSNLNQFFGIDATGLQRLVENTSNSAEPTEKFPLLQEAIEDCFIGRHFIFSMKLPENDRPPWLNGPVPKCPGSKDVTQFIASQMSLPKAPGLKGCTVVTYYQKLLQKASDPSRASRFPATQLLLTPCHTPTNSFNATLSSPRFLLQSTYRSEHLDDTLMPTPPWQQSLGVVTSSAEQEDSGSSQARGGKNNRQTDNSAMSYWSDCLQKYEATEKIAPFHQEQSLSCPSYAKYPNLPSQKSVRTSSNTVFTLSQPDHKRYSDQENSAEELAETFLSSLVNLEDMPLSESLTDFIFGENKDCSIIDKGLNINVLCQKNLARNNMEITSLTTESTNAGQRNEQLTESPSQVLLDVLNIPNEHDSDRFSVQVCKNSIKWENQSIAKSIPSPRIDKQNESEELDFIEDAYNCSADLFGSSSLVDMHTEMLIWKAETVFTKTDLCPSSLKPDLKHLRQSPRENQRPDCSRSYKRKSLTVQDFVPPSQSTPNVKELVSHSFISPCRTLTHEFSSQPDRQDSEISFEDECELNGKKLVSATSVLPQPNSLASVGQLFEQVCAKENRMWSTTPTRCSYKRTTGRRPGKPDKRKNSLPDRRHFEVQRRNRNLQLIRMVSHKRDSRVSRSSVCDNDKSDSLVPPTPDGKIQHSVTQQQTRQLGSHSSHLGTAIDQQLQVAGDGQRTVESSHRGEGLIKCDGYLDQSNDNLSVDGTCDWSRDLFSDSV
ncbi:unnamed protein product [Ophioblennius macclurei]